MINRFSLFFVILACLFFLFSCNKNVGDTSELYEKSQTRDAIIERSGTVFRGEEMAWKDAQNRLQSGGGLFGKKAELSALDGKKTDQSYSSIGLPINPYLWRGSLETISFMPLVSADPFAGIIITEWYSDKKSQNQRCKLNIFIKGIELRTNNLKVNSFCQILNENGNWVDQLVNEDNNHQLENAILNQAKKIKLSQS